nr:3'-5' exonuclease [Promicromonospora sukumoe]
MPPRGHHVILGTAGTGKTVMAVHRAFYLAQPGTENAGPVLLLTYNKSLVTYIQHLASDHPGDVTIETYGRFGRGYLASQGLMGYGQIAGSDQREALVEGAVRDVAAGYRPGARFFTRPTDFFLDELAWIEGNGLSTDAEYFDAERVGRQEPLQRRQREAVWAIRETYVAARKAAGLHYDWASLPSAVKAQLHVDSSKRRYKHIVVDEAQDLTPEAIRSLAAAIPPDGSLTLFADYAQQIYGQRVSWRSCGLAVGKVETFIDNYRNSPEIARLAIALANMPHFKDSADLVEPRAPIRAAGAKPTLIACGSSDDEALVVRDAVQSAGRTARVGILTRTRAEARAAIAEVRRTTRVTMLHENNSIATWQAPSGVYAGTYHSGKGLEFDVVVLPYCSDGRRPHADTIAAFGPDEAASRESRLLYVGVTRARDELIISHTGALTTLLPPATPDLYDLYEVTTS